MKRDARTKLTNATAVTIRSRRIAGTAPTAYRRFMANHKFLVEFDDSTAAIIITFMREGTARSDIRLENVQGMWFIRYGNSEDSSGSVLAHEVAESLMDLLRL
jgi:hypothetical protein